MNIEEINERNRRAVELANALCGAITPNYRRVSLYYDGNTTKLQFVLGKEDADDREEIVDAITIFESTFENGLVENLECETIVTEKELERLPLTYWLTIYKRKEDLFPVLI